MYNGLIIDNDQTCARSSKAWVGFKIIAVFIFYPPLCKTLVKVVHEVNEKVTEYGLSTVDWFSLSMLINGCSIIYATVNRYNALAAPHPPVAVKLIK